MNVVWAISGVLLAAASLVTMVRVLIGPNTLDRLVALDTLVAVAICGLSGWAAYSLDSTVVPAVVALTLLGFLGPVAVARFRVPDDRLPHEAAPRVTDEMTAEQSDGPAPERGA
ncbi:monovalent cation/H+ antiporter complex subunit F [Williamsia sp. CHRR-6]|uniref:monovalent cation/H+ antiporter complex subunit F n=1 Tax=Williamsia sp. CHRR-6 TaxID=2835871 RepID=UPI001BDA41E6|nr:monovalent cation/H+ antiporter complex subunit F [Williamsia sp. CHRR-6]MBT0567024.1 cation:proton antiporter [Williamsia sp. CHRR-6]